MQCPFACQTPYRTNVVAKFEIDEFCQRLDGVIHSLGNTAHTNYVTDCNVIEYQVHDIFHFGTFTYVVTLFVWSFFLYVAWISSSSFCQRVRWVRMKRELRLHRTQSEQVP